MLSKRSLKRKDKTSGRKKPRPNDYDNAEVLPAPDSEEIEKLDPPNTPVSLTPKTPAKPVSSKKTPKSKKKHHLEENTEYTTPKAGKNYDSLMMKMKYRLYHQCLLKVLADFQ